MRAKLTIAPRYFTEIVRKKYTQALGFIWAREVFQNASDAGATRVDIRTGRDEHGSWIEVQDNGPGMQTVLNMLGIGAATKSHGAGGFGTAKEIVLLSWSRWEMESRDQRVTSEIVAGEDDIEILPSPRRGTWIRVWHGGAIDESDVEYYLRMASGPATWLNGERVSPYRAGQIVVEGEHADVYENRGKKAPARGYVVVRWEGITMFTAPIDRSDVQVTMQMKGVATDLFSEARETLRYPASSELWSVRRQYERNPLSTGPKNSPDIIDFYLKEGNYTATAENLDAMERVVARAMQAVVLDANEQSHPALGSSEGFEPGAVLPETHPMLSAGMPSPRPDVTVGTRTGNDFYPLDYVVKRVGGRRCTLDLGQRHYGRILKAWEVAVGAAITAIRDMPGVRMSPEMLRYRVGFVVGGTQRAEFMAIGNEYFFLLNPREVRVSAQLTEIVKNLLALATHEAAHLLFDHGEAFDAVWMHGMLSINLTELMRDPALQDLKARASTRMVAPEVQE